MLGEVESVGVCIRTSGTEPSSSADDVNLVDTLGFDLYLCTTFVMTLAMMKNVTKHVEKDHVIPSCLLAKQETCHQRDKMRLRLKKKKTNHGEMICNKQRL